MLILLIYYYNCIFALNVYFVCGMQTMFFAVHKNDKLLTNRNSYLARFEKYWGSNSFTLPHVKVFFGTML